MREVKLEEITTVSSGQGAPQGDSSYSFDEGIPFIKAGDMDFLTNGGSIEDIQKVERNVAEENKLTEYPKGSIVFAKSGMSAKKDRVYCLEADSYVVNHLAIIEPNNREYLSRFLTYYLQFYKPSKLIRNEAYPSIRISDIRKLKIPLPSLSRQKAIVAKLDRAQRLIDIDKEMLAKYDELIKSVFLEMFGDPVTNPKGWKRKPMKDIGELKSGGTPSRKNKKYFTGDIDWYTTSELETMYLGDAEEKITEAAIEESSAKLFEIGSLLIGMYDTSAFKLGILSRPGSSNQASANIRLDEQICNVEWLYYCLKIMRPSILHERRGIRQKNLTLGFLKKLEIIMPPIKKQIQFNNRLYQILEEKKATEAISIKSEELFSSLVQEAFG